MPRPLRRYKACLYEPALLALRSFSEGGSEAVGAFAQYAISYTLYAIRYIRNTRYAIRNTNFVSRTFFSNLLEIKLEIWYNASNYG